MVPGAWPASVDPTPEPAGSTMLPARRRVWTVRRPAAHPTTVRGRRGLPMRERPVVLRAVAAAKLRARPMKARAPRPEVLVGVRSSSAPGRPERREIPTSQAGPLSYRREGRVPRASPRSAREQPKRTMAHPMTATKQPKASPVRPRAGPSLALPAAEPQSSGRPDAWRRAEPTSMQPQPSGCSAMQVAPEVRPSSSGVGGASSDRGSLRTAPPPPKLCLRIQLASGWRAPFADYG
jgi:hypothetical protein